MEYHRTKGFIWFNVKSLIRGISKLRNKYYQEKTNASALAYRRQRDKCVSLLKKAKKTYFGNVNPSLVCDIKPLFCEQKVSTNSIILIENNDIADDEISLVGEGGLSWDIEKINGTRFFKLIL